MAYVWTAVALLLVSCGNPTTRLALSGSATQEGVEQGSGPEMVMLRSTQSENGFYGKDAEAEINQILRFLDGR